MKRYFIVFVGLLFVVTLMLLESTLQVKPYVTDDGIYSSKISGRTISLQFIDNCTLRISLNPGSNTYKYSIDDDKITLKDINTDEVIVYSFQYLEGENVVVFDGIEYHFFHKLLGV